MKSLSLLLYSAAVAVVVNAENRIVESLNNMKLVAPQLSPPFVGTIHGSGFLSLNELVYSVDGAHPDSSFFIDVIVSTLSDKYNGKLKKKPDNKNHEQEYWQTLGVGATGPLAEGTDAEFFACCTQSALNAGACEEEMLGRMIVSDPSELRSHVVIELSPGMLSSTEAAADNNWWKNRGGKKGGDDTGKNKKWKHGNIAERWIRKHHHHDFNNTKGGGFRHGNMAWFSYTTHVVMVIGNCNVPPPNSAFIEPRLTVDGGLLWISNIGFFADASMLFPLFMAVAHFGVLFWYRRRMNENRDSRIQIEIWIYNILLLAFVSTFLDFSYLTAEIVFAPEREHLLLRMMTDFTNKAAHIGSRCLYVVLAHGLGCIKTQLSKLTQVSLLLLGLLIFVTKEAAEGMGDLAFLRRDNAWKSDFNQERHELLKLSFRLNWIFLFWIPLALLRTMRYLRLTEDQHPHKLQRYRWMLGIFFGSILTVLAMSALWMFTGGFRRTHTTTTDSSKKSSFFTMDTFDRVNHIIYWMVLTSIAVLWKPTPEAPMYGYLRLTDDEVENHNNNAANTTPLSNSNNNNNKGDLELMESITSPSSMTTSMIKNEELL